MLKGLTTLTPRRPWNLFIVLWSLLHYSNLGGRWWGRKNEEIVLKVDGKLKSLQYGAEECKENAWKWRGQEPCSDVRVQSGWKRNMKRCSLKINWHVSQPVSSSIPWYMRAYMVREPNNWLTLFCLKYYSTTSLIALLKRVVRAELIQKWATTVICIVGGKLWGLWFGLEWCWRCAISTSIISAYGPLHTPLH